MSNTNTALPVDVAEIIAALGSDDEVIIIIKRASGASEETSEPIEEATDDEWLEESVFAN